MTKHVQVKQDSVMQDSTVHKKPDKYILRTGGDDMGDTHGLLSREH